MKIVVHRARECATLCPYLNGAKHFKCLKCISPNKKAAYTLI